MRSPVGALCGFLVLVIVLVYSVQKATILFRKKEIDMLVTDLPDYLEETEQMGHEDGLAVAFTVHGNIQNILDPRVANLVIQMQTKSYDETGIIVNKRESLGYHPCTERELGLLGEEGSVFYPFSESD